LVDATKTAEMAEKLYHSLHRKLLKLQDGVIVHPGHGAGSVCGGDLGNRDFTTIGYERANNKWLDMDLESFIESQVKQNLTLASYFKHCEKLNTIGPPLIGSLTEPKKFNPEEFEEQSKLPNHVVLDTRLVKEYVNSHIPNSISLSLKSMGLFTGWVLNPFDSFLFVLENNEDFNAARNILLRIGFDDVVGYLDHGMSSWVQVDKPTSTIQTYSIDKLRQQLESGKAHVVDVRQPHEFKHVSIKGSTSFPLTSLSLESPQFPSGRVIVNICPSGVRSTTGASILKRAGIENIVVSLEGLNGWQEKGYPLNKE
jgi:hydroxyacylglutathione hydrolase